MLTFDPIQHRYFWKDQEVPGVSTIMKATGILNGFWGNETDRERGSAIHKATAFYDEGVLDESTVDPVVRPFLDAWIDFRKHYVFKRTTIVDIKSGEISWPVKIQIAGYEILLRDNFKPGWASIVIETPLYSPHGFAGMPDRIFIVNDTIGEGVDRLAVGLRADGTWYLPPKGFMRAKDRAIFLSALAIFNDTRNCGR